MRRAIALVAVLLACCSREPPNPEVAAAVRTFDLQLVGLKQWREHLGSAPALAGKDFRGRTMRDDLERWILAPEALQEIGELRDRAAAAHYPADAQQLLTRARTRASEETTRGKTLWDYWNTHLPAPYWRRYWHELFASNGVPEETPEPLLLGIEARLTDALNTGDFTAAARVADELNAALTAAQKRATDRIYHMDRAQPVFAPRKTPCPRERGAPRDEAAHVVGGAAVDSFYPGDALKRGEQGTVVLRARVNAAGCGTAIAVLVHSGVPALDDAALTWFETARFAPAAKQGVPIESSLVWKVRFELRTN